MDAKYNITNYKFVRNLTGPILLTLCFLFNSNGIVNSQNVELSFVVPPVTNTQDATPSFVFNSTVAGSLSLGGGLTTPTTHVEVGYNYITLNKLSNGVYGNCQIIVTASGGRTGRLDIGNLTVNAPADSHLWNSIRTAGFDYDDIAVTTRESAEWLANRHDIVVTGNVQNETAYNYMKGANPSVKLFGYISMYTTIADLLDKWCEERGIDPEELYYHYEEDTPFQTLDGWITIPGYGPGGSARTLKEARVRTFYSAVYPPFCPTSKIFCDAYLDYTISCMIVNKAEGKYLDGLFMDGFVNNIWEGRDVKLENTIEMRRMGINTAETARFRVADDMIKMRNNMEQYIEAFIGKEFSISGNISEADYIKTYDYFAKNRFDHVYNEITVEFIADMVRMRIYDIPKLVEVYEAMDNGVTVLTNSQTNYYDKPEAYTDESWKAFIQFTLAVPLLIAHDNGYFSFHKGSASYYGGWPTKGDLTTTHWHINREYDLGKPVIRSGQDYWGATGTDRFYTFEEGANDVGMQEQLKYKVLARDFEKGLVLAHYGHDTNTEAPMGGNPVTIDLGGKYHRLLEDNSLSEAITQITLGKGHGAILVKSTEEDNDNPGNDDPDVFVIDKVKYNIIPTIENAQATTDSINKAIQDAKEQGYKKIRFEEDDYWVCSDNNIRWGRPRDGIFIPSDTELDMNNATLRLRPNDNIVYGIFQLHAVEKVTIKNGHLIGDRYQHTYTPYPDGSKASHEYGFGINIMASDDITVQNMKIEQMTGDAIIAIGSAQALNPDGSSRYCRNVIIQNNELFDCRRQGISICHAMDVYIHKNEIYNIGRYKSADTTNPVDGTDPGSGIDVEPGPFEEYGGIARNVRIHENHVHHCVQGISFHTGNDNEAIGNLVEDTRWEGIGVSASLRIKIYKNTFNRSYIHINALATDVCAPATGEYRNILSGNNGIYNGATMTGNFLCPE